MTGSDAPAGMVHPVLEVGGTHVVAARVVLTDEPRIEAREHRRLDAAGSREHLLAAFAETARRLDAPPDRVWGVAVPGPFDYVRGVGHYRGVGKFDSLDGVDVGAALRARLRLSAGQLRFVNDADAFLLGEYVAGAATGRATAVGLTLGTGVGSAFLRDGKLVTSGPQVPPRGRAHLLRHRGKGLEDWFSRRAIRAAFERARGGTEAVPDVSDITVLARRGDRTATAVLDEATYALANCLAPWLERFDAEVVVIGGSMSRSWDVLEPGFRGGLAASAADLTSVPLLLSQRPDDAALVGAAWHAASPGRRGHDAEP